MRISESLLSSFPPPQAPKWTISKDWLKGMCKVCLLVLISADPLFLSSCAILEHPEFKVSA